MSLTNMQTGCYIDGSHMSALDFSIAIIEFSHNHGFELDYAAFDRDVFDIQNNELDEDLYMEIVTAIDWTYDDALDYLNDTAPENMYWAVRDSSLFLIDEDEADD